MGGFSGLFNCSGALRQSFTTKMLQVAAMLPQTTNACGDADKRFIARPLPTCTVKTYFFLVSLLFFAAVSADFFADTAESFAGW